MGMVEIYEGSATAIKSMPKSEIKKMSSIPNTLYDGDCLDWMSQWEVECVDLIYLDPPFNLNANYNALFKNGGSKEAAEGQITVNGRSYDHMHLWLIADYFERHIICPRCRQ